MASGPIIGSVTRGTTNTNRLRRVDRWIATLPVLRQTPNPIIVDLGYGASGVTTFELAQRLARVQPHVEILGIEVDSGRVATALSQLRDVQLGNTVFNRDLHVGFVHGGFEIPLGPGKLAAVIRAFNVLRQYDENAVLPAWRQSVQRLQDGGLLIDGTCDEIGRVASWIDVSSDGPQHLTISLRLRGLEWPSIVAERLPKILIHRNVEGERIHSLMAGLDSGWRHHSGLAVYGPSQRWIATVESLRSDGWPIRGGRSRWKLGELTVDWSAVKPNEWEW